MQTYHGLATILASRPHGLPTADNFRIDTVTVSDVPEGSVLLQNIWLSIEPYMMLSMKGSIPIAKRVHENRLDRLSDLYVSGVEVGQVMCGPTIAQVLVSKRDGFRPGNLVVAYGGWQTLRVDDGGVLKKIDPDDVPLTSHLGVLGIPGFTAYGAMRKVAQLKEGETMVVSAALGPVGSVAGQMAKLSGARSVGIASGAEKCGRLVGDLGFDAAVDRLSPTFAGDLKAACPNGIDVYFENVGGAVWPAVMPLLNQLARIPLCGLVASYSQVQRAADNSAFDLFESIQYKRLLMRGISVFDHIDLEPDFIREIGSHVRRGEIRYAEDVVEGIEAAPQALIGVLQGKNKGKMLVRLGRP
jgi:NADPH-dependent curcumin reductase